MASDNKSIDFDQFRFTGQNCDLSKLPTDYDAGIDDKDLKKIRDDLWEEVAALQERLFAESKQSLLIVLQAMDAAGKDSTIEKFSRSLNAQGCQVHSFKKPTKLELKHDFLWRIHQAAPAAGEIGIFNRSHYEDVLIVKVHGWADWDIIERRYTHINAFENLLADRGTQILKFMLNISPEYQLSRFRQRLENNQKHWKFNPGDLDERQYWQDYMREFETAISRCASEIHPWYVIPAENRRFRDVMIASVVRDTLQSINPQYPEPDFDLATYHVDALV